MWTGSWCGLLWHAREQRWACILRYTIWLSRGQLGDYGYFTDWGNFCCKGNIFTDIRFRIPEADIIPRQHQVSMYQSSYVPTENAFSLPRNHAFNSFLASLSSQLTDVYLVTMTVRCARKSKFMWIYLVFNIWYLNQLLGSASIALAPPIPCILSQSHLFGTGDKKTDFLEEASALDLNWDKTRMSVYFSLLFLISPNHGKLASDEWWCW